MSALPSPAPSMFWLNLSCCLCIALKDKNCSCFSSNPVLPWSFPVNGPSIHELFRPKIQEATLISLSFPVCSQFISKSCQQLLQNIYRFWPLLTTLVRSTILSNLSISVETQLVSPLVGAPCISFSELLTNSLTTLQWLFTTLRIKWPGPHHDPQALCDVPLSVNCCFLFSPPPLCPSLGSARPCFICDAFAFCCSSGISMSHLSSLRLLLKWYLFWVLKSWLSGPTLTPLAVLFFFLVLTNTWNRTVCLMVYLLRISVWHACSLRAGNWPFHHYLPSA